MKHERSYPGKLLLFGEYTVLSGSRALVVPLSLWYGKLKQNGRSIDTDLLALSNYLEEKQLFNRESRRTFSEAIEQGLYFESSIPRGYGVGSSGALTSAIYEQFFADDFDEKDIQKIRSEQALLEGYFHGKSSGMDPLVSLMNMPILHEAGTYMSLPHLKYPEGLQVFLLDSEKKRSTGDLVKMYLQWTTEDAFTLLCLRPLVQSVDHAISFFIDDHLSLFWEHLKLISRLQFDFFKPMIMDTVQPIWKESLDEPGLAVKLCGAGGGGYYLGFARPDFDLSALPFKIVRVNL